MGNPNKKSNKAMKPQKVETQEPQKVETQEPQKVETQETKFDIALLVNQVKAFCKGEITFTPEERKIIMLVDAIEKTGGKSPIEKPEGTMQIDISRLDMVIAALKGLKGETPKESGSRKANVIRGMEFTAEETVRKEEFIKQISPLKIRLDCLKSHVSRAFGEGKTEWKAENVTFKFADARTLTILVAAINHVDKANKKGGIKGGETPEVNPA